MLLQVRLLFFVTYFSMVYSKCSHWLHQWPRQTGWEDIMVNVDQESITCPNMATIDRESLEKYGFEACYQKYRLQICREPSSCCSIRLIQSVAFKKMNNLVVYKGDEIAAKGGRPLYMLLLRNLKKSKEVKGLRREKGIHNNFPYQPSFHILIFLSCVWDLYKLIGILLESN